MGFHYLPLTTTTGTTMTAKLTKKTTIVFLKALFFFMMLSATAIGQASSPLQKDLPSYPKKTISQIELIAGPSIIYIRGNEYLRDVREAKIGFSGGVGLTHTTKTRFEVNMSFLYENKGSKSEFTYQNTDFNPPAIEEAKLNYTLNYFTYCLLPRYKIYKENTLIGCGPYFSYLTSLRQQSKIYRDGNLVANSNTRPDPDLTNKRWDIGISFMVGHKFSFKKINNLLQIKYNLGLTDIQLTSGTQPIYNNTISIHYGIILVKN